MGIEPREIAIEVIYESLNHHDIQFSLNKYLSQHRLKRSDKNLITTLCYGYLRLKGRIDFILRSTVRGNIKKLPFKLVVALGCAVYEILFLDRIPEYATVFWYVEYCKKRIKRHLSGLTNGVLRHIIRIKDMLLSKDFYKDDDMIVFLSRYYSCPVWIIKKWMECLGYEHTIKLLDLSLQPPKIGIRVNIRKKKELNSIVRQLKDNNPDFYLKDVGFSFKKTPDLPIDRWENEGFITRQSIESQRIIWELEPYTWGIPVWDCCCGSGGKTTFLLERGIEDIFASDINLDRVSFLKKELVRLGLKSIPVFLTDAALFYPRKKPATVFIDAPCSGLGVLSRRPDIKWKRGSDEVKKIVKTQKRLLEHASSLLGSGGIIVYITCTINPEENEKIVRSIYSLKLIKEIKIKDTIEKGYNEFFYAAILKK